MISEQLVTREESRASPPGLAQDRVERKGLPITVEDSCGGEAGPRAANHTFKTWGSFNKTTSRAPRALAPVPPPRLSASLEESWDRDPVQVPLDCAAIECIRLRRRTQYHSRDIDPARSRQAGYFLIGMKSSFRDSREGLARCQWYEIGAGKKHGASIPRPASASPHPQRFPVFRGCAITFEPCNLQRSRCRRTTCSNWIIRCAPRMLLLPRPRLTNMLRSIAPSARSGSNPAVAS